MANKALEGTLQWDGRLRYPRDRQSLLLRFGGTDAAAAARTLLAEGLRDNPMVATPVSVPAWARVAGMVLQSVRSDLVNFTMSVAFLYGEAPSFDEAEGWLRELNVLPSVVGRAGARLAFFVPATFGSLGYLARSALLRGAAEKVLDHYGRRYPTFVVPEPG